MNPQAEVLLAQAPSLIGFIGSVDSHGMPRTVPIWYRWDGETIHITTSKKSVWVNNLIRDGRSSFCVAENGSPYRAVVMQGRAQVEDEDQAEVRRIFARYMSPPQVENYYAAIQHKLLMIRLMPDHMTFRSSSKTNSREFSANFME